MKKTKKILSMMLSFVLLAVTIVTGAHSGVLMANASALPDAGQTEGGEGGTGGTTDGNNTRRVDVDPAGIATETGGRNATAENNPEFYLSDVDKKITKIRPMATPIDQISRYAKSQSCDSFKVKYYSVGTRPVTCQVRRTMRAQETGASVILDVSDTNMFTLDDTIRVVGVRGVTDPMTGQDYSGDNIPDLVLCVCGRDASTNQPIVYAVNGIQTQGDGPIWVPEIAEGTVLVRMGKACGELDVQTGRFNNRPTPEYQYCQNFMIQIEQSTFDKLAAKEVDWNFSDLEEDGIYDMRLAQENTYLFGVKQCLQHVSKNGMMTWFTGGIWWMAGKDIEVGEWDSDKQCAVISDENLVDITKDMFVGTGIGNRRKIVFAGSDMLSAFSKIQSEKFRLKDTVEHWNLKFKSWETDFGEVLMIHHELFDLNGMSDCGFALDPTFLSKKTHVSWSRSVLDLKKAGVRRTDAVVIQEVACLYLRYAKAHARLRLAKASGKPIGPIGIDTSPKTPKITVPGGGSVVSAGTNATISCDTPDVNIAYTDDGTNPMTSETKKGYTGPIDLGDESRDVTIKAVAEKESLYSEVATRTFTVENDEG